MINWFIQIIKTKLCSVSPDWLVHSCQREEDHLNIKTVTALLLYYACTLLKMMKICVTDNNKPKIQPRGMATFKNNQKKTLKKSLQSYT